MKKKSWGKYLVLLITTGLMILAVYYGLNRNRTIDYLSSNDEVAAVVDGEDLTLGDVALYVLYVEKQVEKDAQLYNPENTRDYWNIHTNGIFIAADAKKSALGMAVHDMIFARAAEEQGIELSAEEKEYLENEKADFWMDLLDIQKERPIAPDETINASIEKMALAQKYQEWIAEENGRAYHEYDWDSYDYEAILEANHTVKKNDKVWKQVRVGEVSVHHSDVNFINGMSEEEKEKYKEDKMRGRFNPFESLWKDMTDDNEADQDRQE